MTEQIDKSNPWYRDDDESILEVYDVETGKSTVLCEFDYLIEAPNWSPDGKFLTYNSNGRIFRFDLETKESTEVFTDFVTNCNNDHVLSPEGDRINLKSKLAQYLSMATIFSNGYIKELDLVAHDKEDIERLIKYMYQGE